MAIKKKSDSSKIPHLKFVRSLSKTERKDSRTSSKLKDKVNENDEGWAVPIVVTHEPNPYTLPEELIHFVPSENETHKFFFKGTSNEVVLRQIFFHQPLSNDENCYLKDFREYCKSVEYNIPFQLEPMLLRVLWYNKRKYGDETFFSKSVAHLKDMYAWRLDYFSIYDTDTELNEDLKKGIMYWVGRDAAFRPLLIVRLNRMPKNMAAERFEKLTIFCFEWALRYLMLPGRVETCTVLVDVRGVPLFQVPASALKNMINVLTKHYPFRLSKMWIIHEMSFMQALWSIAKQFLTEVQQAKIAIYRNNIEQDLAKEYPMNQLEQKYGGLRPEITTFYPFPLVPGPFETASNAESNTSAYKNAWKACDSKTAIGVMWEGDVRTPIQWADGAYEVFTDLGLPPPISNACMKKESAFNKSDTNSYYSDGDALSTLKSKNDLYCSGYKKTSFLASNTNEGKDIVVFENTYNGDCTTSAATDGENNVNKQNAINCKQTVFSGPSSHTLSPPIEKATENDSPTYPLSYPSVKIKIDCTTDKEKKNEENGKFSNDPTVSGVKQQSFSSSNKNEDIDGKLVATTNMGNSEKKEKNVNDSRAVNDLQKKGLKVRNKNCCHTCVTQ